MTFARDGLRLAVVDTGGDGAPVVFQHGLGGDRAQIADVFPDQPGLRRITLECRAHGASEAGDPARFAIATFADDVAACAAAHGIDRAVIGGISMGAAIALRLAVMRPGLTRALILGRPAWGVEAGPANLRPILHVAELLARLPPDRARAAFDASDEARALAEAAPDNLATLRALFDRADPATTAALLRAIALDGPGVTLAQVAALSLPTLVIGTDADVIHPLDHARLLARTIPGARLVRVTSKSVDRARYAAEMRAVLHQFITELPA